MLAAGAWLAAEALGAQVLEGATALALSMVLCWAGSWLASLWGLSGTLIPIATALTVALATLFPTLLQPLVASGEGIAAIVLHVRHPAACPVAPASVLASLPASLSRSFRVRGCRRTPCLAS